MADSALGPVVAAADFKDWWFIVWLRPGKLVWPPACACCLAPAPGNKILTVKEKTLIYPLCGSCARHGSIDAMAIFICLAIGVILPAVAYYSVMGFSRFKTLGPLMWGVYTIAVLVTAGIFYWPVTQFTPGKTERCADNSWAVEEEENPDGDPADDKDLRSDERLMCQIARGVTQAHGSGLWCLRFTNKEFTTRFIKANGSDPVIMRRVDAMI